MYPQTSDLGGNRKQRWYAIHTYPKQESRAERNLRAWKVESFSPKFKERRCNPYTGVPSYFVKYLFPQYIFARFEASILLRKICFTRGVRDVVDFGNGPAPVDDEIIDLIKSRIREDGYIKLEEAFKPGDKLLVRHGALKNLAGIFDQELKGTDRIVILLTCVSYQNRIVLKKEQVTKAVR